MKKQNEVVEIQYEMIDALMECYEFMGDLTAVGGAGVREEDMAKFTLTTNKMITVLKKAGVELED